MAVFSQALESAKNEPKPPRIRLKRHPGQVAMKHADKARRIIWMPDGLPGVCLTFDFTNASNDVVSMLSRRINKLQGVRNDLRAQVLRRPLR
jgi:bacterioferritin (cytochrome b1)